MSHKQLNFKDISTIAKNIKEVADAQDAIIRQMWEVTQAVASGTITSSMMAQAKQIVESPVAQGIIRNMGETLSLKDHLPPGTPVQQLDEGKFKRVMEEFTDD